MSQLSFSRKTAQAAGVETAVDLTVVGGAGHVGIPLALSFASKGLRVMINDLNETALAQLRAGVVPFIEHGAQELLRDALDKDRLGFTSRHSDLPSTGAVILTIGTPVDDLL